MSQIAFGVQRVRQPAQFSAIRNACPLRFNLRPECAGSCAALYRRTPVQGPIESEFGWINVLA
jgi:hypothetical protein